MMMMNEEKNEMRINDAPRLSPNVKAKSHTFLFISPTSLFGMIISIAPRTLMDENKCISLRTTRISINLMTSILGAWAVGGAPSVHVRVRLRIFLFVTNRSLCK
jgi:hypothetical protein